MREVYEWSSEASGGDDCERVAERKMPKG